MFTPRLFNLQRLPKPSPPPGQTGRGALCVLQLSGAALVLVLAGCAGEPDHPIDQIIPLQPAEASTAKPAAGPLAEALRAKARALAFADPEDAKAQARIDSAMLSQGGNLPQGNPAAQRGEGSALIASTQRFEGSQIAPAPARPQAMSQGEMLWRLHELAQQARPAAPRQTVVNDKAPAAATVLAPAVPISLSPDAGAGAK